MKRRLPPPTSLTSLLDVLFILVFAALIHSASTGSRARAQELLEVEPDAAVSVDAGFDAGAGPSADRNRLGEIAVARLADDIAARAKLLVTVSHSAGEWRVELERKADDRVGLPILDRVDDPEIGLVYAGDRDPEQGLCALIAGAMGRSALEDAIVIVSSEVDADRLPVALVRGLGSETARCRRDFGAFLMTLSPKDLEP